jgi:hypothetical protein
MVHDRSHLEPLESINGVPHCVRCFDGAVVMDDADVDLASAVNDFMMAEIRVFVRLDELTPIQVFVLHLIILYKLHIVSPDADGFAFNLNVCHFMLHDTAEQRLPKMDIYR